MNQYWIIALLLAFVGVGFAGYRYGSDSAQVQCDKIEAAQQQVTIAGQQHVITEVGKQQTITTGVSNAYHTGIASIDNLYATASVQPANPTGGDNNPIPRPSGRANASSCRPSRSKYYKLNGQECDDNTEQLIDLQNWIKQQAALQ